MVRKPQDQFAPVINPGKKAKSILILTADDTQDLEFFYPYYRFIEEGFAVDVATPKGGAFTGKQGMGLKDTKALSDINSSEYDLLYIPGGKAPEALKKNEGALALARSFARERKPIAAICHGAQVLAAADLVRGFRIAAWPEVQEEVEAAGAQYADEPAVTDGLFITARWPGDLPHHMAAVLKALQGAGREGITRRAS